MRLSLAVSTEPRDSVNLNKDASLENCYIDKDPIGTAYVVKRPGFYPINISLTVTNNRGIFFNPNVTTGIYYVNNSGSVTFISI